MYTQYDKIHTKHKNNQMSENGQRTFWPRLFAEQNAFNLAWVSQTE